MVALYDSGVQVCRRSAGTKEDGASLVRTAVAYLGSSLANGFHVHGHIGVEVNGAALRVSVRAAATANLRATLERELRTSRTALHIHASTHNGGTIRDRAAVNRQTAVRDTVNGPSVICHSAFGAFRGVVNGTAAHGGRIRNRAFLNSHAAI